MRRFNVFACVMAVLAMLFLAPMADAACFPRLRAVVRAVARPFQTIRAVRQSSVQTFESTTTVYSQTTAYDTPIYIGKGSAEFAAQLNREGRLRHDGRYIGYENVSYGSTTPEGAVRQWMASPPHRANLPFITDIKCNGPFCVGR